jgi:hypothetical protein
MSPNAALEKVAMQSALKPGEINLVARAYNVAQTNDLRETGGSFLEKAGSFTPAEATVVCDKLFPKTKTKAAAALTIPAKNDSVSSDYFWNPAQVFKTAAAAANPAPVVKYAHLTVAPAKQELSDVTKAQLTRQAVTRFKEATYAWFEFERKKTRELEQAIGAASAFFEQKDSPAIASVRKAAQAYRGDNVVAALDAVLAANPRLNLYRKHAEASQQIGDDSPALTHLERIVRAVHEKQAAAAMCVVVGAGLQELAELGDYLQKAAAEFKANQNKVAGILTDFGGLAQVMDTANNMFSLPAVLEGAKGVRTDAQGWSPDPIVQDALTKIDTPTHSAALKRLAVASNLHNVLTSDPHLKGYDPKVVAKAFNQLVQLNPNLLHKDLPVRMALRRQLAQDGLELFEQEQLAKFENNSDN